MRKAVQNIMTNNKVYLTSFDLFPSTLIQLNHPECILEAEMRKRKSLVADKGEKILVPYYPTVLSLVLKIFLKIEEFESRKNLSG